VHHRSLQCLQIVIKDLKSFLLFILKRSTNKRVKNRRRNRLCDRQRKRVYRAVTCR
jgi:hypothetical protein